MTEYLDTYVSPLRKALLFLGMLTLTLITAVFLGTLAGCTGTGSFVRAGDFSVRVDGEIEGTIEVRYRDEQILALVGGAEALAETHFAGEDRWWAACEHIGVEVFGARFVLLDELQGEGPCAESAGESIDLAPTP